VLTRCRPKPLSGERGISGSLVRLHLDRVGDGPTSVVAKLPPADPTHRAQLQEMGFFEREVCFYRDLAAETPVDVPRCHFAAYDASTGDALLVLEDLASLRNGDTAGGGAMADVTTTILALARLHARWWQDSSLAHLPWTHLPSMLAPTAAAAVFERAWPSFLDRLSLPAEHDLGAIKATISRRLHRAATTLLETGPRTLIHNDVQPDNLFFTPEPHRPVIFIDWQMMTYGRCVVDVANVIQSTLPVDVRRQSESALVRSYHEALVAAGVRDYPLEQCEADYDLATVLAPARLATAVGLHPGLRAHPGAPWDALFVRLVVG
jgi:aminoglycoside/choline kinase family phosphotransferase